MISRRDTWIQPFFYNSQLFRFSTCLFFIALNPKACGRLGGVFLRSAFTTEASRIFGTSQ